VVTLSLCFQLLSSLTISRPFPYTTLFRSPRDGRYRAAAECRRSVSGEARFRRRSYGGCGRARLSIALRRARGGADALARRAADRSEEHTSELQSRENLVFRLLLEKKKYIN